MLFVYGFFALWAGITTAVDAARFPASAYDAIGTSRATWIVTPLVGIVFCGFVAIIARYVWQTRMKARVAQAAAE